jgi:hypothetical protein
MPSSFTVTLNHVRYGRYRFDLAELKKRLETAIVAGADVARLGDLLIHTNRLMLLIAAKDAGRGSPELDAAMNAEFAFLLLGFEHVQQVMEGSGKAPRKLRKPPRALPRPKKKPR